MSNFELNIQLNKLLIRLKNSETDALDEIYESIGSRLFYIAYGIANSKEDAEDILQDAMITLVKKVTLFKIQFNAYGWIATIVRNTALNYIKKENKYSKIDLNDRYDLSDGKVLEEEIEKNSLIEQALNVLDKREAELIKLKYYSEMTARDIEAITAIPKSTVARVIKNAECKMVQALNDGTKNLF